MKARIFNIVRSSLHDGDGIRTVVYFKGCNLRCGWCHNPEGISTEVQVLYRKSLCIRCGRCVGICPDHHVMTEDGMTFVREGCTACTKCAEACPNEALSVCGRDMAVEEVYAEIVKDAHYFEASGGGVTFSGGECLLQVDSLKELLVLCRNGGIHTAVESAFHVPWKSIDAVRDSVDTFLIDIKHSDDETHRQLTGVSNELILRNIRRISECHSDIHLRIPLIPGANDDDENLIDTAGLIGSFGSGIKKVELLKYNDMGMNKYVALGKAGVRFSDRPQEDEEMQRKCALMNEHVQEGIRVVS